MDKIIDKVKQGRFLVDEWCKSHSKYDIERLREELEMTAITMGLERVNVVLTDVNEVKSMGGDLTQQEQGEQRNISEVLKRLDKWLFYGGNCSELQKFIIALNKIGYRLDEAQLYLGSDYEREVNQIIGLVEILETLDEDALCYNEEVKNKLLLDYDRDFEKRFKPLFDYSVERWESSLGTFRKNWFKFIDELVERGDWSVQQGKDYKGWFYHLDYLFVVRLKQFQKVFRGQFMKQKEETSTINKSKDNVSIINPINKKYYDRAVAKGYADENEGSYVWNDKKIKLGYFVYKVYCQDITDKIPYKAVEEIFGTSRLDSTIYSLSNAKNEQKWREKMDKEIFFD